MASLSYAIHRYNGPLQSGTLGTGDSKTVTLAFGNEINVMSLGPYVVTNTTESNHWLRHGVVVRWVGVDGDGNGRIYTYGEGINTSRAMATLNTYFFAPLSFLVDVPLINSLDSAWFRRSNRP